MTLKDVQGVHLGNVKCLQVNATPEVQRIQLKDLNMFYEKSNGLPKGQKRAKYGLREGYKAGTKGWRAQKCGKGC